MSNLLNLSLTQAATERLRTLANGRVLRLDVKATGCSGNSYDLKVVDAADAGDDLIVIDDIALAIPKMKSWMLIGTTIDYQENDFVQEFVFSNPNEKGRCGCGESFVV